MPTPYIKNKKHIMAWREAHMEQYKEYSREYAKRFREDEDNKQYFRDMRLKNYYMKKEMEIFRNILL